MKTPFKRTFAKIARVLSPLPSRNYNHQIRNRNEKTNWYPSTFWLVQKIQKPFNKFSKTLQAHKDTTTDPLLFAFLRDGLKSLVAFPLSQCAQQKQEVSMHEYMPS